MSYQIGHDSSDEFLEYDELSLGDTYLDDLNPNDNARTAQFMSTNANAAPCQMHSNFMPNFSTLQYQCSQPCLNPNLKAPIGSIQKVQSSLSLSNSASSRRKFTEEEDRYLTQLVEEMGPKKWEEIAKRMPNRTARQCRDRYSNYLIPGFFNGEWSSEEDELLYQKYHEIGPRWAVLKEFFKNRSPNSIKNRWNYFVSRPGFGESLRKKKISSTEAEKQGLNLALNEYNSPPSQVSNEENGSFVSIQAIEPISQTTNNSYQCSQILVNQQPSQSNFYQNSMNSDQNKQDSILVKSSIDAKDDKSQAKKIFDFNFDENLMNVSDKSSDDLFDMDDPELVSLFSW